jgi:hypothetical protein
MAVLSLPEHWEVCKGLCSKCWVSDEEWCCGQCGREGPESDDSSSGRSEQQTAGFDFVGLQGG